ncbi:MAG: hypothetical protein KIT83_16025 [Bryobacterales bacterium]|nr:hypothetical protein [Bryobacterales bacterium]
MGLILPVMPGWIFLIPGLLILGDYFPPVKRLVLWAKRRFKEAEQQFRNQDGEDSHPGPPDDSQKKAPPAGAESVAVEPADSQQ